MEQNLNIPSVKITTSNTDVIKLFISGLICYFLGIFYNVFVAKQSIRVKHFYSILTGLAICYFNFGIQTIHSLLTCFMVWSTITSLGPTLSMVVLNCLLCMTYLLYGYYQKHLLNIHALTWTLPQCVLTLSLMALSFDIYDGHKNNLAIKQKNNKNDHSLMIINEDSALPYIPSFLEILSKVYFPPTFLIGPQVKFKDYLQFIQSNDNLLSSCWKQSILRFISGAFYFVIFQIGNIYWPIKYLTSQAFKSHGLFMKLTIIALVNKMHLCKYISGWLISEGSCIMFGISRDPNSNLDDRCCNVSLLHFETTATFRGVIESFNISTNQFAAKYIYKRLKFLRSKMASQAATLFFLALWHGFALGYYNTFAMELIIMKMENDIAGKVIELRTKNQQFNQLLNRIWIRWTIYILMRLHVIYMLSYCFVSFAILDFDQWVAVLNETHFIGHYIYSTWFIISIVFSILFRKKSVQKINK